MSAVVACAPAAYRIVSRPITHKVGRGFWQNQDKLKDDKDKFVTLVKLTIEARDTLPRKSSTPTGRALTRSTPTAQTFKCEHHVHVEVGSTNSIIHSYPTW